MTTAPRRTLQAVFGLGDVSLKIWAYGETPRVRLMTTLEKLVDPAILKKHPYLAYTFTPQDISAIQKLTKEAEDALFNFQSMLLRPIDPAKNQGQPPAPNPSKDGDANNDKTKLVDARHEDNQKDED